jgi:hypothetical protein
LLPILGLVQLGCPLKAISRHRLKETALESCSLPLPQALATEKCVLYHTAVSKAALQRQKQLEASTLQKRRTSNTLDYFAKGVSTLVGRPGMQDSRAFITKTYEQAWDDFLKNRTHVAGKRALSALQLISKIAPKDTNAELLIEEADLSYIAGAVSGDDQDDLLKRAISAYTKHLELVPSNNNARRMMAETMLRLHDYEQAFKTFFEVSVASQQEDVALQNAEVAPFRLIHDAEQLEFLVARGKIGAEFLDQVAALRQLAAEMHQIPSTSIFQDPISEKLLRMVVDHFSAEQMSLLQKSGYNRALALPGWVSDGEWQQGLEPLNPSLDWAQLQVPVRLRPHTFLFLHSSRFPAPTPPSFDRRNTSKIATSSSMTSFPSQRGRNFGATSWKPKYSRPCVQGTSEHSLPTETPTR